MCGRYSLITDAQTLQAHYRLVNSEAFTTPRFNIAPSQPVPAIVQIDGERHLELFQWGLLPAWAKERAFGYTTINARAETVASKPAFRSAFRQRRCLIPADGFYEWQGPEGHKQAWRIEPQQRGQLLSFAGLWEVWEGEGEVVRSCTMIVVPASATLRPIHARMPLLLTEQAITTWLDPTSDATQLQTLLEGPSPVALHCYRVGGYVNNPQHDDPDCLRPLA